MSNDSLQIVATQAAAGWYHALCQGLQLDPTHFQLASGNGTPFGQDSTYLWQVLNTVPPYSATSIFGSSSNLFSSDYGSILNNLSDPPSTQVQEDLGDYYEVWLSYQQTYKWATTDTLESVFRAWAQRYFTPGQIDQYWADMASDSPIGAAKALWQGLGVSDPKAYTLTFEMVENTIRESAAAKFTYDSAQSTKTFSDTWAQDSSNLDLWYGLFGGSSSESSDTTSQDAFSGSIQIAGSFAHVASFSATPLYQNIVGPNPSNFKPWYDSTILSQAYRNQDNHDEIWNTGGDVTWEDAFGASGFLRYVTTGLVIVDGLSMTMTVKADFTDQDQQTITSSHNGGLWPFFYSSGSAGFSYSGFSTDSSGFSVTVTSPEGNHLILGANVDNAATAFAS
jgi:hypothetical protein